MKEIFLSFFRKGTNESSSRLIGFIIVINALALVNFVVIFKILTDKTTDITSLLLAAGGMFIQIAGSAMYFLFKQKKNESLTQP